MEWNDDVKCRETMHIYGLCCPATPKGPAHKTEYILYLRIDNTVLNVLDFTVVWLLYTFCGA